MAERAVRTVKENTVRIERYQSEEEMFVDILHYQDKHNFQSRLRVLGYRTPYQTMIDWFDKEQKLFIKHPNELLIIR
jgi:hypothetical protein